MSMKMFVDVRVSETEDVTEYFQLSVSLEWWVHSRNDIVTWQK